MIDAHVHLWLRQQGRVNGLPVYDLGGGKSQFGAEVRQMLGILSRSGRFLSRSGQKTCFAPAAGAFCHITNQIEQNQSSFSRLIAFFVLQKNQNSVAVFRHRW